MMSLANILKDWELWGLSEEPVETHQVKLLAGGLTNICYRLTLLTGDYILRISAANTNDLGIDRDQELRIHQFAAEHKLTSPLRYCSKDNSYWIRDYIEGEILSESVVDAIDLPDSILAYMVEQLKFLHQLSVELDLPQMNISDSAERYWQIIENNNSDDELLKMKPLMQVAMKEAPAGDFCLCHLDPVLANWVYTPDGLQLLDWEYAGLAHPLWDLAAFWQGIKEKSNANKELLASVEQKIITLYGVSDLTAWRRANVQMEYLSSLWYRAQE
jgi:thiamine kinase-like enzyme